MECERLPGRRTAGSEDREADLARIGDHERRAAAPRYHCCSALVTLSCCFSRVSGWSFRRRCVSESCAACAIAAGVLIALDLPHPTSFGLEVLRVLYTFLGVGLAVLVMLLATQLGKRSAKPVPQTT